MFERKDSLPEKWYMFDEQNVFAKKCYLFDEKNRGSWEFPDNNLIKLDFKANVV